MDGFHLRYTDGAQQRETDGPLFFDDVMGVLESQRRNPTSVVIISFEKADDPTANAFWSNKVVYNGLVGRVRVSRLNSDSLMFETLSASYKIETLPSILILGPGEENEVIKTYYPSPIAFCGKFKDIEQTDLSHLDTAVPVFTSPEPTIDPFDEPPRRRKIKKVEEPIPEPVPKSKAKVKQETHQKGEVEPSKQEKQLTVTVKLTDMPPLYRSFSLNENYAMVKLWISNSVGLPASDFRLFVLPSRIPFDPAPTTPLSAFYPSLSIELETKRTPTPRKSKPTVSKVAKQPNRIMTKIREIIRQVSPFAQIGHDRPDGFW